MTKLRVTVQLREVLETQPQHFRAIGIVERIVEIHFDGNNIWVSTKHVHDDFPPMYNCFSTTRDSDTNLKWGEIGHNFGLLSSNERFSCQSSKNITNGDGSNSIIFLQQSG